MEEGKKAKKQNHCSEQLQRQGGIVQQPLRGPEFSVTHTPQDLRGHWQQLKRESLLSEGENLISADNVIKLDASP